jgi:hypothetical protein
MSSVLKWVGVTTALAFIASVPAKAQVTKPLSDLNTPFSVPSSGGWTVDLTSCGYTNSGTVGNCGAESVVASVAGNTLSLVFEGTNGPSSNDLLYNTGGTGIDSDLTLNLTVTSPTGQQIVSASDALGSGSTHSIVTTAVSANESFTTPTETSLGVSTAGSLLQSETFSPTTHAVTGSNDINVELPTGGSAAISTVTLTFTTAPEPISSSLLAVGIAGIGFVRRKIRRPR